MKIKMKVRNCTTCRIGGFKVASCLKCGVGNHYKNWEEEK